MQRKVQYRGFFCSGPHLRGTGLWAGPSGVWLCPRDCCHFGSMIYRREEKGSGGLGCDEAVPLRASSVEAQWLLPQVVSQSGGEEVPAAAAEAACSRRGGNREQSDSDEEGLYEVSGITFGYGICVDWDANRHLLEWARRGMAVL